jgi:hypothetical protein
MSQVNVFLALDPLSKKKSRLHFSSYHRGLGILDSAYSVNTSNICFGGMYHPKTSTLPVPLRLGFWGGLRVDRITHGKRQGLKSLGMCANVLPGVDETRQGRKCVPLLGLKIAL